MTNSYELPPYPDPITFRMIGAVFWLGLLVTIIPQWFIHPVEFSPEGAMMKSTLNVKTLSADTAAQTLAASVVETTQAKEEGPVGKSELYIEAPLTVKPPTPDPARVQALKQPIQMKEAQTDQTGKLVVNKDATALNMIAVAPEIVADGKVWLQVASYTVEANAQEYQTKFKSAGFPGKITLFTNKEGKVHYQLRVGPYRSIEDAKRAKTIVDNKFKTNAMVIPNR